MVKGLLPLFLLATICSSALAEGNPYILLRPVQGIEQMPSTITRQLQRISLQIIAKQPGYDLLLSGADLPESSLVPVFAVEGQVSKSNGRFNIETRLLDIKSKKVVTKAARDDIREEDLIRLYQAALESLFIPDNKVIPVKEETIPEKIEVKKNPITKKSIFTSTPDYPSIDFRKRILALQKNTDLAISEFKEDTKVQDDPSSEKPVTPARGLASGQMSKLEAEVSPKPQGEMRKYPSNHKLGLGYSMISINSEYYINTTTSIQAVALSARGHFPFSFAKGKMSFSYDGGYLKAVGSTVEAPPLYSLSPGISWLNPYVKIGAYLGYETSFFTNIDGPGKGLKVFSLNPISAKLKAEFNFNAFTKWDTELSYSHVLSADSDYGPLSSAKAWSGSGIKLSISPDYNYMNWHGVLSFEQKTLTSQGETTFSYNDTRAIFAIQRSL